MQGEERAMRVLAILLTGAVLQACGGGGESDARTSESQAREVAAGEPAGRSSATTTAGEERAATPSGVTVVAKEYTFVLPTPLAAGVTTIRLSNEGREGHHMQLYRLEQGKTAADLLNTIRGGGPGQPLPQWVVEVGGPNGVMPGEEVEATFELEPGSYVAVCWVPDSAGVPHLMKGMVQAFEIPAGSAGAAAAEIPEGDITMRLVEYDFEFSKPLSSGTWTVRVENEGEQAHEVQLFRFAPEKRMTDLRTWLAKLAGPPPGEWVGGVAGIEGGADASFKASFEPGTYALICFVTDEEDGKFHFDHGMIKEITIS
jgi:hypothetical protein